MGLDRSGKPNVTTLRSGVAADDTGTPTDTTYGIAVPPGSRGSITHVLAELSASNTSGAMIVTLFGYNATRATWYVLAQLNGGSTITRTSKTPVAAGSGSNSRIAYAESFLHISMYDRLYALVTSIAGAGASVSVYAIFEGP